MKKVTLLFLLIFTIATTHAQNYQISFAGVETSTALDSVKVENLTQCTSINLSGSDTLQLAVTTGINEGNTVAENTIHTYPNPMAGACSIDFEATTEGKTIIGLYDITGKRILQAQEFLLKGHHTYRLSGISSGVYTLKIESDKFLYTAKIESSRAIIGTPEIKNIGTIPNPDKQSATSNLPTGQAGTQKMINLKSGKSIINMQYTAGDILKLTGKSGVYRTVFMLTPTQTQTVTFSFVACTDADNNNYAVVQIGSQLWMAENLNTTHYRNGNSIPYITDNVQWRSRSMGAYCNYNNDSNNVAVYSRLYNWYAVVDTRNVCPTGWHVPTNTEWTTLSSYLDQSAGGGKMKENCKANWNSPNTGATNESGFTALPGGLRETSNGTFYNIGSNGGFWSVTGAGAYEAWYSYLNFDDVNISSILNNKATGYSVRCLKD